MSVTVDWASFNSTNKKRDALITLKDEAFAIILRVVEAVCTVEKNRKALADSFTGFHILQRSNPQKSKYLKMQGTAITYYGAFDMGVSGCMQDDELRGFLENLIKEKLAAEERNKLEIPDILSLVQPEKPPTLESFDIETKGSPVPGISYFVIH